MVNSGDEMGRVPLHYAALHGDIEVVKRLLDTGGQPDAADFQGQTPLHFAAQQGHLATVNLLVLTGVNVDATDLFGNTPLWTATYNPNGRGEIVRALLSAGADPLHRNNAGKTPLGLAQLIGNADVTRYFSHQVRSGLQVDMEVDLGAMFEVFGAPRAELSNSDRGIYWFEYERVDGLIVRLVLDVFERKATLGVDVGDTGVTSLVLERCDRVRVLESPRRTLEIVAATPSPRCFMALDGAIVLSVEASSCVD